MKLIMSVKPTHECQEHKPMFEIGLLVGVLLGVMIGIEVFGTIERAGY